MKYFIETLRLYPPIGALLRKALNDYKIPGSDAVIEKGNYVVIPVQAIHHDSKYYYDPKVFDPARFSSEQVKKRPKYAFMPFGDGPRYSF